MSKKQQLPVTLLTGFLGAGKTTFLNRPIAAFPDKRFAIIENEFGEESIDHELVIRSEDGIFELSNGCICCTLSAELADTLARLLTRQDQFEHLLIETTGMADAGEVAGIFLADPEVKAHFHLDSIVGLVDAEQFFDVVDEQEEVRRQIAFSDLLLVNKSDLVDQVQMERVDKALKELQPFAEVVSTVQADPGPELMAGILNRNAFHPDRVNAQLADDHGHGHHHHHEHSHDHHHHHNHDHDHHHGHDHDHSHGHHHHSDVVTHSFRFTQPLDPLRFNHWMQVLLMMQGSRFYRIKGILQFPFREEQVVFQSVGKRHMSAAGKIWEAGEERESRIVFIGKDLRQDILAKGLRNCFWQGLSGS